MKGYEENGEPILKYIGCSHCNKEIWQGDKYYLDNFKRDRYCLNCANKYLESAVATEKMLLDANAYGKATKDGEPIIEGETYYSEEYEWFYKDKCKFLESAVKVMTDDELAWEWCLEN